MNLHRENQTKTQSRSRYRPLPRVTRVLQQAYPNLAGAQMYVAEILATYRRMRDDGCDCADCRGIENLYRSRIAGAIRHRHNTWLQEQPSTAGLPRSSVTLN